MGKGYSRRCRYCGMRIFMAPRSGGWVPLEPPDVPGNPWNYHDCVGISQGGAARRIWSKDMADSSVELAPNEEMQNETWMNPSDWEAITAVEAAAEVEREEASLERESALLELQEFHGLKQGEEPEREISESGFPGDVGLKIMPNSVEEASGDQGTSDESAFSFESDLFKMVLLVGLVVLFVILASIQPS